MRASENQRVDGRTLVQIVMREQLGFLRFRQTFFHQMHEQRAGLRPHIQAARAQTILIGAAIDGAARSNDPDASGSGELARGAHAGIHHAPNRNGHLLRQARERGGRGGVAGDDHGVGPLVHKETGNLPGELFHHRARLTAIGHARRVADVEKIASGKFLAQRLEYGEAADARIENADGVLFYFLHA